jgi:hypothetical protein
MKKPFSCFAFVIASIFLAFVVLIQPRYQLKGTEATLAWDVSGYYLYLPAIFIYKDVKQLAFLPGIVEKYQPSYAPDQAYASGAGTQIMKYSCGMAVLYLPFFLLAHVLAGILGYPADGFSLPYQACVHWGSVLVAISGLWFLRKNLLRFFDDRTCGVTLFLIAIGTNFLNYSTYDAAMPHAQLFALLALLIHLTILWHERPTWQRSLGIGLCIGLSALIRPTELLFALVPLLWGLGSKGLFSAKWNLIKANPSHLALAVAATGAVGFLQLAYWQYVGDEWLVYSYQEQGFRFGNPHFSNVLFSYRKGWFVYTPLMLFAVGGGYFLAKKYWSLFLPTLVFFLLNLWIVCAWDIWWYGGGFGQRAMIQSYALLAFPLAAFIAWAHERSLTAWLFAPLLLGCVVLNLFQTWQAHNGPFETEAMTKAYYWRIFGKLKNDPYDRFLLDTNEEFSGKMGSPEELLTENFEEPTDSLYSRLYAQSGTLSTFTDPATPYSHTVKVGRQKAGKPGQWLRVSASFYAPVAGYEAWWMPQLVVRFEKNGQSVKEKCIRPHRVLTPKAWKELDLETRIPEGDFEEVKVFLWNANGPLSLFMDDLKVEVFSPE